MIDTPLQSLTRTQFSKQQTGPYTEIPKQFYKGQPGTTVDILYTAPAVPTIANQVGLNPKAAAKEFWIANVTATAATITLYIIESGGLVADNRAIMKGVSIQANTSYQVTGNFNIEAGGTVQGLQGTASAITVEISGVEYV